ncbi:Polar growth protein [Pleurotus pulmonarius]
MPEYVYALHDFQPEHEDEVPFRAGERIEVVEKDDQYGDGWWQGRNLAGKVGLFPEAYTTPAPPTTGSVLIPSSTPDDDAEAEADTEPPPTATTSQHGLHTLTEESETDSVTSGDAGRAHVPLSAVMGSSGSADSGVMNATMTDVQEAIEQLGRRRKEGEFGDGERSFSFASTGDGDNNSLRYDGETDESDGGEGWHKGARQKLAEKARKAVEEAEKLESIGGSIGKGKGRIIAPPIDVEMSDESEDEGGDHTMSFIRGHAIPEESEEESGLADEFGVRTAKRRSIKSEGDTHSSTLAGGDSQTGLSTTTGSTAKASDSNSLDLPSKGGDEDLPTVTQASFPTPVVTTEPPADDMHPPAELRDAEPIVSSAATLSLPSPISPTYQIARSQSTPPPRAISPSQQQSNTFIPPSHSEGPASPATNNMRSIFAERRTSSPGIPYRESMIALPSPTLSSVGGFAGFGHSKHSSIASSAPGGLALASPAPINASASTNGNGIEKREPEKEKTHPSDWSVEEVVEWLKSKGFDQDVCDKFTEQEITGDVLLELDVNLLKSEIGIMAFGKRMRIANAITDLRRPPSIVYSDHPSSLRQDSLPASPMHPQSPPMSSPMTHSPQMHSPLSMQNLSQVQQAHMQHYPTPQYSVASNSVHSRNVSQSHSFGGYTYNSSAHQSLNSPVGYGTVVNGGMPNNQVSTTETPTVADGSSQGGGGSSAAGHSGEELTNGATNGLGLNELDGAGVAKKARPAQLNLSPSESTLNNVHKDEPSPVEEEKAFSESEAAPASSVRRRFFGGSARNSSSSHKERDGKPDRTSKDSSSSPLLPGASPTLKDSASDKERDAPATVGSRHRRNKNSVDTKPAERLSIFAGSFANTLGKSRKPPPSTTQEEPVEKTSSSLSFSRLYGGKRPATSQGMGTSPKTSPRLHDSISSRDLKEKDSSVHPSLLRKRTVSASSPKFDTGSSASTLVPTGRSGGSLKQGQSILEQIGDPDHNGWMRKKSDRYKTWKTRYFVLKGPHLYCLRSNSRAETKIKGYINIVGYKVTVDENVDPGRYGFRIDHENDKTHYFSSEEKTVIRGWMKAMMKATIARDYTKPVVSSCNIPTIPLTVAQAMNPAPRPPSPTARDATQKALRRENPHQLSSRDAEVLMGLAAPKEERTRLNSFFSEESNDINGSGLNTPTAPKSPVPPRPAREARRLSTQTSQTSTVPAVDDKLIDWANGHLPSSLQIVDPLGPLCNGLALLRLAESIKGSPSSPPVPDSAFPRDSNDDKLDGLFKLFDFLLDNDVKIGSAWEEKRIAIAQSIGKSSVQADYSPTLVLMGGLSRY